MINIKSRGDVNYHLLISPLFLSGLILLLVNDFYLKQQFHNYITGKLSDVAGLFIFPFFISVFIGKPKIVYLSTAIFFVFWKLEISQPFIDFLSLTTTLNIYRIVDITDLIAILILPISYFYYLKKKKEIQNNNILLTTLIGGISIFAFCATTVPPPRKIALDIEMNKIYDLSISKDSLLKCIHRRGNDGTLNYSSDTLYYLYFTIPEYNANIKSVAKISNTKNGCVILLQRIINSELSYKEEGGKDAIQIKKLSQYDFDYYFKTCFIEGIHKKSDGYFSEYPNYYTPIR